MAAPEAQVDEVVAQLIQGNDAVAMEAFMAEHGVHEDLNAAVAKILQADEDRSTPAF